MSKELAYAQLVLADRGRERLRVEKIQDIARFATLQSSGELMPPDLKPLVQHLTVCELCREDLDVLTAAINSEFQARMDFLSQDAGSLPERQAQEDWMWENR